MKVLLWETAVAGRTWLTVPTEVRMALETVKAGAGTEGTPLRLPFWRYAVVPENGVLEAQQDGAARFSLSEATGVWQQQGVAAGAAATASAAHELEQRLPGIGAAAMIVANNMANRRLMGCLH